MNNPPPGSVPGSYGYLDEDPAAQPPSRIPGTLGSSPAGVYYPTPYSTGAVPSRGPARPAPGTYGSYGAPTRSRGSSPASVGRIVLWSVATVLLPLLVAGGIALVVGVGLGSAFSGSDSVGAGFAALGLALLAAVGLGALLYVLLAVKGTLSLFEPGERTVPMVLVFVGPVVWNLVSGSVAALLPTSSTFSPFGVFSVLVVVAFPFLVWLTCARRAARLPVAGLVVFLSVLTALATVVSAPAVPAASVPGSGSALPGIVPAFPGTSGPAALDGVPYALLGDLEDGTSEIEHTFPALLPPESSQFGTTVAVPFTLRGETVVDLSRYYLVSTSPSCLPQAGCVQEGALQRHSQDGLTVLIRPLSHGALMVAWYNDEPAGIVDAMNSAREVSYEEFVATAGEVDLP